MLLVVEFRIIHKRSFVDDHTSAKAEKMIELTHPACVTLCKVVIDRDDMHTLTLKSIQIGR
ncbi:hypothetical protein D3C85_1501640 [compost metagenome]